MFLRVRAFPALRIPNFKTTAPADECHLAFELEHFAKLIREEETTLLVRGAVLSAGMGNVGASCLSDFQQTEIIIAPSIKTEGKLFQTVQSVGMGTR